MTPEDLHELAFPDPSVRAPARLRDELSRFIQDWRDGNCGEDTAADTAGRILDALIEAAPKHGFVYLCGDRAYLAQVKEGRL